MNILLEGYLDRNFGDDMMLRIAAYQLKSHNFFISENKKELLLPFKNSLNIYDLNLYPQVKLDATLKVIGSGFTIRNKMGILSKIIYEKRASKSRENLSVINCNIGPMVNGLAHWLIKKDLKQYGYISVREQASKVELQKMFPKASFDCFPDMVFSIPDEWLFESTGEDCLGISVYRQLYKNNLECYQIIAKIADYYIETRNKKVLLFAFDIESENDLASAHTIKSLCENKNMIEIISHQDNGDTILKNYARCNRIIGIRCHSIILALRMGIPVIPVIYSDKTDHILDDIGYDLDRLYLDKLHFDSLKNLLDQTATPFPFDKSIINLAKNHTRCFEKNLLS